MAMASSMRPCPIAASPSPAAMCGDFRSDCEAMSASRRSASAKCSWLRATRACSNSLTAFCFGILATALGAVDAEIEFGEQVVLLFHLRKPRFVERARAELIVQLLEAQHVLAGPLRRVFDH